MIEKLNNLSERFAQLEQQLADPDVMKDMKHYKELMQERSYLAEIVEEFNKYTKIAAEIKDAELIIEAEADHEMREMAREELRGLETALETAEVNLRNLLGPKASRAKVTIP